MAGNVGRSGNGTRIAGLIAILLCGLLTSESVTPLAAEDAKPVKELILPGESFLVAGRPAFVLLPPPEKRRTPQPWILYSPTLPAYPDVHEKWMHEQFLSAGIAIAGVDVGEAYGSPAAWPTFTALHTTLTNDRGFAPKACLLGRSRGGLWSASWGAENTDKISGLAGIYPVFDFRTYPGIAQAASAYGRTAEELAKSTRSNPIARVEQLAASKVPAFFIHGDEDVVVPLKENSQEFANIYERAGVKDLVTLIVPKGQGHNYWEGFFRCEELVAFAIARANAGAGVAATSPKPPKLVIVAGKPSHPPRMHEFNAGTLLLANCLKDRQDIRVEYVLNGWPADESIFDDASAIVFYMDGSGRHELVQENGRRLKLAEAWAAKGVGLGFMHFGVEVVADQAGRQFKRFIGGHYDHLFSCNPIWEPEFTLFPDHPITRGVQPFKVKDEWYFNMRFIGGVAGNTSDTIEGLKFQPILVATPPDEVRDGPYVYPKGPYPHIQANKGRAEAMLWTVERPEGGRGFGFTGGHFHDNWGNDNFRKTVLNAMLWITKVEVPQAGVESHVAPEELNQNLDPKQK